MRSSVGFISKIAGSRTLRTTVALVFLLNTVFLVCVSLSFSFLRGNGFYATGGEALQDEVTDRLMASSSHEALLYFHYHLLDISEGQSQSDVLASYAQAFREENSNFFFYFRENGRVIFNNFQAESGRSYYPKAAEFFDSGENATLIRRTNSLTFESHLKKTLTANDVYLHVSRFFHYANALKYAVLALMILSAAFECVLAFVQYAAAGHVRYTHERDLDRIPLYLFVPFSAAFGALCVVLLRRQTAILSDPAQMFSETDLKPTLYAFFLLLFVLAALLQMLISTVGVRVHRPLWWRHSILYRTFAASGFGQRARTVLSVLTVLQFALYFVVFLFLKAIPSWIYVAADGVFMLTMVALLYVVWKDMSVYIPQTRRIAAERSGFVTTDGLSDSGRRHAENVNFLSRSANAQTEKRYVNESFSTELIHSVSHGLREPLNEVSQNVCMLEQDSLTQTQAHACIERILSLSQDLKKTIEDMILISKAATGNLPFEPVPTDAGMMLSQAVGEFDAQFSQKGVEPVVEQPEAPVQICADGQFMWYVFEGILSVMLENAVAGTRLFLRAAQAGENAVIVFRCTVRAEATRQLRELSGMGLSSAKVFTLLQGGTMVDHLSHDTLTAVVQFPVIRQQVKKEV